MFKKIIILISILCYSYAHTGIKAISIEELEELKTVGIKIIDIRQEEEIKRTGMIPTSYKLNFYKEDGKIDRGMWLNRFINLVKETQIKFVLISTDGKQAKRGAHLLHEKKKYQNPYYLEGGMNNWIKNNKKTIKLKDRK